MAPLADVFIRIRADGTQAEATMRRVSGDARRLDGSRININVRVDGNRASAELERLKRQVRELQAESGIKFATRIDTEGLQRLGQQIGRITVGIPAAVGALGLLGGAVASLGAGFFALASSVAPAAGALAALPSLASAAAQGVGVAAASFSGIGDAVKAMMNVEKSAGLQAQQTALIRKAAAEQIREANQALENAVRNENRTAINGGRAVREAMQAVADARINTADRIKDAEASVVDAREQAGERIKAAEERLADAQRTSRAAQEDLNRARRDAKEELEDLANQLKSVALSEEDAQLGLERAQARLEELRSGARKGSDLDLREADLNVRQAAQRLVEVRERHGDIKAEVADANKKGVSGADAVVRAQQRLLDSRKQEAKAARDVRDAQVEGAKAIARAQAALRTAQVQGARDIARAQQNAAAVQEAAAQANADAARATAEAQREVARAIEQSNDAIAKQSSQALGLAHAMSQLSPAGRDFATFMFREVIPAMTRMRDLAQEGFLPSLTVAMRKLGDLGPIVSKGITSTAKVLGELAITGANMMTSGPWKADFATLVENNVGLIRTYGQILFNVADAFRNIAAAAIPLSNNIANTTLKISEAVKTFFEAKRQSGELAAFFDDVWKVLQQLGRIAFNIGATLVNLGKASREAGDTLLTAFEGATEKWREFTGSIEGQNELREFFNNSAKTMIATGKLIAAIGVALAKLGADPNLAPLIDQVREQFLPALGRLYKAVSGDLGPRLVDLATNIVNMIESLTRNGGAFNGFVDSLNAMVKGFTGLMNGPAGPVLRWMLYFVGYAAGFAIVAGFFGRVFAAAGKMFGMLASGGKVVSNFFRIFKGGGRGGPIDGLRLRILYAKDALGRFFGVLRGGRLLDGIRLRFMYLGDALRTIGSRVGGFLSKFRVLTPVMGLFAKLMTRIRLVMAGGDAGFIRFPALLSKIGGAFARVGAAIRRFGGSAFGKIGSVVGKITGVFAKLGRFLAGKLPLFLRIATVAIRVFLAFLLGSNPIGWIITGLTLVGIALVVAYKKSETFRNVVDKAFAKVKEAAAAVVEYFKSKWPAIKNVIVKVFDGIKAYIRFWIRVYSTIIKGAIAVVRWFADRWGGIKKIIVAVFDGIKAYIRFWVRIYAFIINGALGLIRWVREKWPAIKNFFTAPLRAFLLGARILWGQIRESAVNFVNRVKLFIRTVWTGVKALLVNPIREAVGSLLTRFDTLRDKGKEKLQALVDFAKGIPAKMKAALSELGNQMKQGVGNGLEGVLDFIDQHLIGNLNKITSKFGVDIPKIEFNGFAQGGVVPGLDKGHDSTLIMARGGEGVLTPKTTQAIGGLPGIMRLNRLGEQGLLNGMGGPSAWERVKSAGRTVRRGAVRAGRATINAGKSAVDFTADVAERIGEELKKGYAHAVRFVTDPFLDRFSEAFGGNLMGSFTTGVLRKMRDAAVGKAANAEAADAAPGGSFAPGLALLISKLAGGVSMPLRPGTYRVGAGFPFYPSGRRHTGQDFPAPTGTPVYSPLNGYFRQAVTSGGYGRHANVYGPNGMHSILGHLSAFTRGSGLVRRGEMIGRVGSTGNSTGPHLHMEFRRLGQLLHPRSVVRYDTGGLLGHGQVGINTSRRPERVLSGRQTVAFERLVSAMEKGQGTGGRSMQVVVNVEPKQRRLGYEVGDAVANTAILYGWV